MIHINDTDSLDHQLNQLPESHLLYLLIVGPKTYFRCIQNQSRLFLLQQIHQLIKQTDLLSLSLLTNQELDHRLHAFTGTRQTQLRALIQLFRKLQRQEALPKQYENLFIRSSQDAAQLASSRMMLYQREVLSCLFLDTQHKVIAFEPLFFGTMNRTLVYPREVCKRALLLDACSIILIHNHPSGNITPSQADLELTDRIKECCRLLDIRLLDHLIVSGTQVYSMAEHVCPNP